MAKLDTSFFFYVFPASLNQGNIIERNARVSFFVNWVMASFLAFVYSKMSFFGSEGKLYAVFFLCSFLVYSVQFGFQKKFQNWILDYEQQKTEIKNFQILNQSFSFILSLFGIVLSYFFFPADIDNNDSLIKSIFLFLMFGYGMALVSNEILISFFIKRGLLSKGFIYVFGAMILFMVVLVVLEN